MGIMPAKAKEKRACNKECEVKEKELAYSQI